MLSPDILLRAYAVGLFPMAEHHDESALYWIDPEKRGILPIERFRIPRRLRKTVRQNRFQIQCDTAFEDVIRLCAEPTAERKDTWINQEIIQLYINLFEIGRAHSVEDWLNGKLVGGLYGVALGGAFFGESMFSRADDASKVALVHLVARLKSGGFTLLDTQFVTNHLNQFGAAEIHRSGYKHLLSSALDKSALFKKEIDHREILDFIQSTTQMS
ncbi:MAG: leucyl/phenylalanyl-tRNA--protein transferase [Rhodospirillales bacterium]|nr:leucyl/phenylalanyl-tRNA--protein transferase [Rhodospirillales bacterium]